jgi:chromosome segregation ATPase
VTAGHDRSSCEVAREPIAKFAIFPPVVVEISRASRGTAIALFRSRRDDVSSSSLCAEGQMSEERFDSIDRHLEGLDQHFERVDGRLDGIDQRLDKVDGRLDGIDQRLDKVDGRLDGLDRRMDGLDQRIDGLRADLNSRFDEARRYAGVLSEEAFARIAATREYTGPTRAEMNDAFADLKETLTRRLDPLEATVRQHSVRLDHLEKRPH